ncbi:hypothetical protein LTR37_001454 [Vermiconidia calcicola]|uniref:Uncharacterized protein n=1 Tax=Vermiconidia calcicola TaxID=1690605 RepID=A0ACC3NW09_9PEZI|nr:hypothetical protein LTR37_001454 [Vermiconidia calcicola]
MTSPPPMLLHQLHPDERHARVLTVLRDACNGQENIPVEIADLILLHLAKEVLPAAVLLRNAASLSGICKAIVGPIDYTDAVIEHRLRDVMLREIPLNISTRYVKSDSQGMRPPSCAIPAAMPQNIRRLDLTISLPRPRGLAGYMPQYPGRLYLAQEEISRLARWLPNLATVYITINNTGPRKVQFRGRHNPNASDNTITNEQVWNELVTLVGEFTKLTCSKFVRLLQRVGEQSEDLSRFKVPRLPEVILAFAVVQRGILIRIGDWFVGEDAENRDWSLHIKLAKETFVEDMMEH